MNDLMNDEPTNTLSTNDPMQQLLTQYASKGTDVQLRFKNDPQQGGGGIVGPGKLEVLHMYTPDGDPLPCLFKFLMPVFVGTQGKPPKQLIMPICFRAEDVLWASTGPLQDDQPAIITPGGGRGPRGIHIPGT